ncbi:MAG: hypothetical protein INR70_07350 [Parafilimonas terrae]|nr:hypothetical protein [Parafilimonas terrae]
MAAVTSMFFLFVVLSNGPISLTAIGDYKTKAECTKARDTVENAAGKKPDVQFVCVSQQSLSQLEKANN